MASDSHTSPIDVRWIGRCINQDDMPWWAVQALNWVAMVKRMMELEGDVGHAARLSLDLVFSGRKPLSIIPALYADIMSKQ